MLGDSEYGQVFLSQDPRLVGYKNRINLYSVPPPYQLNVELFEKLALDRLSILKAIETASIRNTLKKDKAYNPLILSIIKDLLPLSRNNLLKTSVSARRKELKKEFILLI